MGGQTAARQQLACTTAEQCYWASGGWALVQLTAERLGFEGSAPPSLSVRPPCPSTPSAHAHRALYRSQHPLSGGLLWCGPQAIHGDQLASGACKGSGPWRHREVVHAVASPRPAAAHTVLHCLQARCTGVLVRWPDLQQPACSHGQLQQSPTARPSTPLTYRHLPRPPSARAGRWRVPDSTREPCHPLRRWPGSCQKGRQPRSCHRCDLPACAPPCH